MYTTLIVFRTHVQIRIWVRSALRPAALSGASRSAAISSYTSTRTMHLPRRRSYHRWESLVAQFVGPSVLSALPAPCFARPPVVGRRRLSSPAPVSVAVASRYTSDLCFLSISPRPECGHARHRSRPSPAPPASSSLHISASVLGVPSCSTSSPPPRRRRRCRT